MEFSKQDGTTSVKVHHAPGGKSNFSLAWDEPVQKPKKTEIKVEQQQPQKKENGSVHTMQKSQQQNNVTTSVKVHNPPGGRSNFTLG